MATCTTTRAWRRFSTITIAIRVSVGGPMQTTSNRIINTCILVVLFTSGHDRDFSFRSSRSWPCNNASFTPGPKCNLTTGLPWVGDDGHHNPYGDLFDRVPMDKMTTSVQARIARSFSSSFSRRLYSTFTDS